METAWTQTTIELEQVAPVWLYFHRKVCCIDGKLAFGVRYEISNTVNSWFLHLDHVVEVCRKVTLPSGQLRRAMVECVEENEDTVRNLAFTSWEMSRWSRYIKMAIDVLLFRTNIILYKLELRICAAWVNFCPGIFALILQTHASRKLTYSCWERQHLQSTYLQNKLKQF